MINQEFDVEELISLIQGFLFDNFAMAIILAVLIVSGIVLVLKFIIDHRTENRRQLMRNWGALKAKQEKLTNRLRIKLYPFGEREFDVAGDIYVIDSRIHEQEYTVTEVVDKSLLEINSEIAKIEQEKEAYKKKYPSSTEKDLERFETIISSLKNEKEKFEQLKKNKKSKTENNQKLVIKDKTETYIALSKKTSQIVGIRYTNLKPTQTLLSQSGFLALSRIDPRRNNWLFYLIIVVLLGLEFILTWAIFTEVEPTFLFDPDMWGWYVALIVAFVFAIYIIRVIMGFYAIVYAKQITREDIQLITKGGNVFTVNIKVFWVKTYFYPGIRVEEVLDVNTDSLAKEVNQDNRKLISELSTQISTLRGEIDFLQSLLNEKSQVIDSMQERILVERYLGYYEGIQDNSASPTSEISKPSVDWTVLMYRSIPFLAGLIALVIAAIGIKFIADAIHLDSIQTTILLLGGVGFIVFLLLMALRSVFESSRRAAVG